MNRYLITPLIFAAVGCASVDESSQTQFPISQEIADIVNPPQPPPPPPAPPVRPGRNGFGKQINSAMVYEYEPDRVYNVTVAPERATVLQFGNGEQLVRAPITGDPDLTRWIVESTRGSGDFVTVRTAKAGYKTNLFITTTAHDYQIDLVSKSRGMDRVRWTYPVSESQQQTPKQPPSFNPNTYSRTFEISNPSGDHPDWMPVKAYEIGGKSFIEFPNKGGPMNIAPSLNKTGGGSIPFRITHDKFYEIDSPITDAELRLDASVVRIKRQS